MFLNDKKFLGQKIKFYRKLRSLTQAELAEKIGISEKHLSKVETGLHYPSISAFWDICEILTIPLSEFGINIDENSDNKLRDDVIKDIYLLNDLELEYLSSLLELTFKKFSIKSKS